MIFNKANEDVWQRFLDHTDYRQGEIKYITLHWSAGNYEGIFHDYHFNITGDGLIHLGESVYTTLPHTWRRNSANIGISCSCMLRGYTPPESYIPDLKNYPSQYGKCPPKSIQTNAMIWLSRKLLDFFKLPPNALKTHCDWALTDGYGPGQTCERWDWWKEGPVIKQRVANLAIRHQPDEYEPTKLKVFINKGKCKVYENDLDVTDKIKLEINYNVK